MISVTEAKNAVQQYTGLLSPLNMPVRDAAGLILAQDIFSAIDFPSFNQSSMDGYAFRFADWKANNTFTIGGEIPAGKYSGKELMPGEAMRIFTGAPLPHGADTIVIQEKVTIEYEKLIIHDSELVEGAYVRKRGAQNSQGSLALKSGTKLAPAAIAYLASLGITEVNAFPHPRISIITTGNEIKQPGDTLALGEIYECNSFGLSSALNELNIRDVKHYIAGDNEKQITDILKQCLKEADITIITGGVSVGAYDFVPTVCQNCGVEKIFHNVRQKPGKPLFFGKYKNSPVFGLPGNPLSVLCCYYEYVLPAIKKMMGHQIVSPVTLQRTLSSPINKKAGLTFFVIGKTTKNGVEPLPYRESYQLSSFALADCIIQLEEKNTEYQQNSTVTVHLLS
jgi:molybdopterin molybdotransferase